MKKACAILCVAVSACRAPAPSPPTATEADGGGFVVTLGNDTLSAESFTRVGDRIDGVIARRSPRATVIRYSLTLTPAGLPARLQYNTRLPDGSMLLNGARTIVATFSASGVVTDIVRDTGLARRVELTLQNAFPEIDGAVSFYALPIAGLKAMNRDSAMFNAYPAGASAGEPTPVASRGANRHWVYSFGSPIEVMTDAAGRIVSVDAGRTTSKFQTRRQANVDVPAMARVFAERERVTGPMTALSPRDSAAAEIGGARIAVDYGSPSARGRRIWGPNGVLGDTLWRTGANASTKLTTSSDLSISGRILPPGTYVLTTLAIPGRYQLIFSARDAEVARVPLQATPIDPRVERFTIRIDPAGERAGTLRLRWDTLELSAPFSVPR